MVSQAQFISKIISTGDFSIVTLNNLSDKYFFNYKAEFNYIVNHYSQYKKVPDKETFLRMFPDFDYMQVQEPFDFLLEQVYNDYNASYLATRFNEIKRYLESDQTEKAVEYFKQSIEDLHQGAVMTCTDLLQDTSRYDHYVDRTTDWNKYYISTGFPELDRIIGGIDRQNEDMVIAARTGNGKSWTLIKMAVAASMQGLTVGIYSGEMSVDKVGYRVDTLLGHIRNSSITRGDLYIQQEYKRYIDSLGISKYGPIKVITPTDINGPANVPALKTFIEREHLDILFVDQYSLLEDTSKSRIMHERVANISTAIKNLQVMTQIPIIAVSQMNRQKNEDGSQDTTQIGLSDKIGQDATVLLMLDFDKENELLTINIVKSRDGGDGRKLKYHVDLNLGEFIYIPEGNDMVESSEGAQEMAAKYTDLPKDLFNDI